MTTDQKTENVIHEVIRRIIAKYQPKRIVLFGSHAYGSPGPDSDIDLLIIKETKERPIDRRVAVRKIISDPSRRTPIEILVLTSDEIQARREIGDQFIEEIMTGGEVLYAA
ncbi:MAG: hypothetical protein A2V83_01715 [Nitrospirae bacterium RBG_16_64_22]|nr:MAG: hypothetical protein A2V83_01715 [Nitrospirae bacterium RBG_16_64_22]